MRIHDAAGDPTRCNGSLVGKTPLPSGKKAPSRQVTGEMLRARCRAERSREVAEPESARDLVMALIVELPGAPEFGPGPPSTRYPAAWDIHTVGTASGPYLAFARGLTIKFESV